MALKPDKALDDWWDKHRHDHWHQERTGTNSCLLYFERHVGNKCKNCGMDIIHSDVQFASCGLCESCFELDMDDLSSITNH